MPIVSPSCRNRRHPTGNGKLLDGSARPCHTGPTAGQFVPRHRSPSMRSASRSPRRLHQSGTRVETFLPALDAATSRGASLAHLPIETVSPTPFGPPCPLDQLALRRLIDRAKLAGPLDPVLV